MTATGNDSEKPQPASREVVQGFRLSPQQKRLWRLQEVDGEACYRARAMIAIDGELDRGALQTALEQVVARHEVLRTRFWRAAGMELPLQVIEEEIEVVLHWLTAEAKEGGGQILEQLPQGSPSEGRLRLHAWLRAAPPGRHLLLIDLPALCADAATLGNLAREIGLAYGVVVSDEEQDDEAVQYADIAEWQNELLESADTACGKRFWREMDFSARRDARLCLEAVSGRSAAHGFEPRVVSLETLPGLLERIETFARRHDTDLAVVLLSAWQILLGRLAEGPAAVIGLACSGRRHEELKEALGLLVRYLPLPFEAGDGETFTHLVERLAAPVRELEEWQNYFEWEEGGDGPPFFSFCFDLEVPPPVHHEAGVAFSLDRWNVCADRFRLKLSCRWRERSLITEFHYDAAALRREDVDLLAGWYHALLSRALESPHLPLSEVEMLTERERRQVLVELNATTADLGTDTTLHELFARQAELTPDAVAVADHQRQLTYHELRDRVGRLAGHLRRLGILPETRVAVGIERSPEMVVGLLASLEAGGAYVPLDPAYPPGRLTFMMEDSGATLLLTEERLARRFSSFGGPVVCLDRDWSLVAERHDRSEEPPRAAGPDTLAYIIYTSGSTGRPKGVMVSHRAIANRLLWMQSHFPLGARDRVLQKTPYSFDASIWEIFLPLLMGARLALAEPDGHRDPAYLLRTIAEQGVTILQAVPSLLSALLEQPEVGAACRSVGRTFCGGEALPATVANRALEQLDGELCNLYGPTEAAIDATFHPCARGELNGTVPIGRPLSNVQVYLLDERRRPVPHGLRGEIYIGGAGLARGYSGRPELAAERFVPDPFGPLAGGRLYRTGDLARRLPGGDIEFLGRGDQQVKIRGFRIELGEIESVLSGHPGVREAVVLARGEAPPLRLAAYVVLGGGVPQRGEKLPTVVELTALLAQRLPDYMLPADLVLLEELPRLPSGKLDRSALAQIEPERSRPLPRVELAAPHDPTQEILAGLWTELLEVDRVGPDDDFFAVGGHSLLATQLVSRVREVFDVEIKVRSFFEEPTLSALADKVEAAFKKGRGLEPPPVRPVPRGGPLSLSFAQERLWFLHQLEPESSAYNIPSALLLNERLEVGILVASLQEIVRRHESLRTVFGDEQGEPVQVILDTVALSLPVIDLNGIPAALRDREVRRLANEEARRPFDLARGPLMRTALLCVRPAESVALFTLHHIVSDAWSMGVFIREITALYQAFSSGQPSPLPELPVQYADYAWWQREWMQGEVLERQLSWWRQRFGDGLPVLNLPTDRPRQAVPSWRGAEMSFALPARLYGPLRALSRQHGATLFMVLMAGFHALLQRYTGDTRIVVGADAANRNRSETERLIGFFVDQMLLVTDLSDGPAGSELLRRVREETIAAYTGQELPFQKIVEILQPERTLSRAPLFHVVFFFEHAADWSLELLGWSGELLPVDSGMARFDMEFGFVEGPQGLRGAIRYSTELFDASSMERFARHYCVLIEALLAHPERPVPGLPLLLAEERHQIVFGWNDTAAERLADGSFVTRFAACVVRTPDAVAAVSDDHLLSYHELDRRADGLAACLVQKGAGPEVLVALVAERGLEFLVAVLAIFKAGAVYLPLDPTQPVQRLGKILERSGASLILAETRFLPEILRSLAPWRPGTQPELLELGSAAKETGGATPRLDDYAGSLAYIIYTSGSTGLPKGAMVHHQGMLNHLDAKIADLGLTEGDVVAQTATQVFDISVWQLLSALLVGGRVHIFGEDVTSDPFLLLDHAEAAQVTVLETVPSLVRILIEDLDLQEIRRPGLAALRWFMVTGEALLSDLCRSWLSRYPAVPLVNAYGPTECSDDVSHCFISKPPGQRGAVASIGRPIRNTRLYVLSRDLEPLPVGVAGELLVGGLGVGRGYLGEPRRTAEVFVPDPLGGQPGGRLYRTGDLVRLLADGNLEFFGRLDHQVKIRGYRIEPGEIEAVLAEHASLKEAVVMAREDAPCMTRLVAYVVPHTAGAGRDAEPDERTGSALETAEVNQWREVFDEVYRQQNLSELDSAINLRVWVNSYTGEPMPEDEILECVEDSVERILALKPQKVLEIGCGTGLLLSRIAPSCSSYWGTDISGEALRSLAARLEASRHELPKIELLEQAADDLRGIPDAAFDVVVINEVAQYLPSIDYLVRVLEGVVLKVCAGGHVFVGGLRNFNFLDAFHASVQLHQAADSLLAEELVRRVRTQVAREKELLVAPEFFGALRHRLPEITEVGIQLKGGRAHNELSRFRYDAILRIGAEGLPAAAPLALDWCRDGLTFDDIRRLLSDDELPSFSVSAVPNARLQYPSGLLELIKEMPELATVGDLRRELDRSLEESLAIDPAEVWDLGTSFPYRVDIRWTDSGTAGSFDVLFRRYDPISLREAPTGFPLGEVAPLPWSHLANDPLQVLQSDELVPELRAHLAERLPDYMVPSAIVLLDLLPLTASGKVDRRALPMPERDRPDLGQPFIVPRTGVEEKLAQIWSEVLGLERVGVRDNFFDLGGHSLLATRVGSRLWKSFDVQIPVRDLFAFPTIESLAGRVEEVILAQANVNRRDELLDFLDGLDEEGDARAPSLE